MKAAPFDYVRVSRFEEVGEVIAAYGDDAQVIAGGQSLIPAMAMRMARPRVLIDIARLPGLSEIRLEGDALQIGALVRYFELQASPLVAAHAPLVRDAVPLIAHEAIRSRGTLGGNLAHADPASEMPAVMLALDATIVVKGPDGERRIAAADFFLGTYTVDLELGEIITAVSIPRAPSGRLHAIDELVRRAGDYAAVGGAFVLDVADGVVTDARLAVFAVCDRPLLAIAAAGRLRGQPVDALELAAALDALADEIEPMADLHNQAATKRHLLRVLTDRLLRGLAGAGGAAHG